MIITNGQLQTIVAEKEIPVELNKENNSSSEEVTEKIEEGDTLKDVIFLDDEMQ